MGGKEKKKKKRSHLNPKRKKKKKKRAAKKSTPSKKKSLSWKIRSTSSRRKRRGPLGKKKEIKTDVRLWATGKERKKRKETHPNQNKKKMAIYGDRRPRTHQKERISLRGKERRASHMGEKWNSRRGIKRRGPFVLGKKQGAGE